MLTWNVGGITITRVGELLGFVSLPPEKFFVGFDRDVIGRHLPWLIPDHYSQEHDRLIGSVHSWLIRTDRHTILLDCCAGNHKNRPGFTRFHQLDTPYLQRLCEAGTAPEDVDIVLCTHLHSDHVGWNTMLRDGRWVPTFPNAKYLFSRIENDWGDPRRNSLAAGDLMRANGYLDSVLPVIEAGQAELIDCPFSIDDTLLIELAPGHTRGHVVLKVNARAKKAVFCGDALHHPLQVYAPHWNSSFCELPDEARATRREILEHCVEYRALLFPIHFGAPHVAAIARSGDGFSLRFVNGAF